MGLLDIIIRHEPVRLMISSPVLSVADSRGFQYMMANRVAVGEYCHGEKNALTPAVRDQATQSLYDSTVGVLSGDTMDNPSIYVTYHDAQAYPEVSRRLKDVMNSSSPMLTTCDFSLKSIWCSLRPVSRRVEFY